jgi:hypothetical protein
VRSGAGPSRVVPLASLAGVSGTDFPSVATLLLQHRPSLAACHSPVILSGPYQLHTACICTTSLSFNSAATTAATAATYEYPLG